MQTERSAAVHSIGPSVQPARVRRGKPLPPPTIERLKRFLDRVGLPRASIMFGISKTATASGAAGLDLTHGVSLAIEVGLAKHAPEEPAP